MVSAELPESSSWVPGHKYMQMFHVRDHEIIIVIQNIVHSLEVFYINCCIINI